jgi:hypothetical protein
MTLTTLRMSSEASRPIRWRHEKDQHGWQHEVRDCARTLGSI